MWKQQGGEPNADDVGVVPRLAVLFLQQFCSLFKMQSLKFLADVFVLSS
jgi:hypothetical protein